MRVVRNVQIKLDETDVSQTIFDLRSRDDISVILHGLQHLYMNEELRQPGAYSILSLHSYFVWHFVAVLGNGRLLNSLSVIATLPGVILAYFLFR
jgi:hypothetical protein